MDKQEKEGEVNDDTTSTEDALRTIRAKSNHLQDVLVEHVKQNDELQKHVKKVEKLIQDSKEKINKS